MTTVLVSGGFDPVHIGHVRMFQEAKKLGDKLIVLVNNDNWIKLKKVPIYKKSQSLFQKVLALSFAMQNGGGLFAIFYKIRKMALLS